MVGKAHYAAQPGPCPTQATCPTIVHDSAMYTLTTNQGPWLEGRQVHAWPNRLTCPVAVNIDVLAAAVSHHCQVGQRIHAHIVVVPRVRKAEAGEQVVCRQGEGRWKGTALVGGAENGNSMPPDEVHRAGRGHVPVGDPAAAKSGARGTVCGRSCALRSALTCPMRHHEGMVPVHPTRRHVASAAAQTRQGVQGAGQQ